MLGVGLQRAVMLAGRTADRQTSGQLLLSHCRRAASTTTHNQGGVGFIFDIDGVLVRGKRPLPAARRAFHKLLDSQGHFLFPVVFVTNAGNCLRRQKAEQLSHILGVQISEDQVMLSHSPLQMFQSFHDKCVLVSGQGPVLDIANNLGFQKAVTIDQLREQYPLLDMVDHNRRPKLASSPLPHPKVEAIILLGEPVRWETNLQLVIDVLLTNGNLGSAYVSHDSAHLPVLACNMDLLWMAEAPSPRFGHGMFMACLENVYRKLTGRRLQYEALLGKPSLLTYQHAEYLLTQQAGHAPISTLYAIGDNLMTDIYGANLYNRYLGQRHVARSPPAKLVAQGSRDQVTTAPPQDETGTAAWDNLLSAATATSCQSILVCTGVYNPQSPLPSDQYSTVTETMFHGQRDFLLDPGLVEPHHIVDDVEAAVDLVFKQEGLNL